VAENNRSVIETRAKNPYLLQRKASNWAEAGQRAKLFDFQASLLARNLSVVDLKAQKFQGVEERTEKLLQKVQHPTTKGSANALSVLNAAASTHDATPKETARMLGDLSKERPHDVGLALSMIQIQLKKGRAGAALSSLEDFLRRLEQSEEPQAKDVRHSPGLVALAVSLMRSRGHLSSAKAELVKAANHWNGRDASSAASVLREAGIQLSKSSTPDDLALAGSAFKTLFDEDQGSPIASAGLVAALAVSDPSQVKQHIAKLPPIDTLVQGVDVNELLSSGVVAAPQSITTRKRAATAPAPDRATKKRRRAKMPKNYEEGKTPDPERWLPLRDRSSYRPKGKKGKKKAAESTQGGMVKEEETLELVGGGGVKVERASGGGGASGKKKKKGKK
jgi:signal recognition particle subunit SRP72